MTTRMQYIVGVGLCALTGLKMVPHTLALDRYEDFLHLYNPDGSKAELDSKLDTMAQEVYTELNMHPLQVLDVKYFTAFGMDLAHMGSFNLRTGSIIGLPKHFAYNSLSDVEKDKITARSHPIDWDSEEGHHLQLSLVLSDQAKKFGIARELSYLTSHTAAVETFLATGFTWLAYTCGAVTNNVFQLRRRGTLGLRLTLYVLYGSLSAFMYLLIKDSYNNRVDVSSDKMAASVSKEYLEGGIEFYDKVLLRNAALRDLLPEEEGKSWYTKFGNRAGIVRTPSFPLTGRRDLLKRMQEE